MTAILRQADVVPHRFTVAEFLEVAATTAFDGRRIELIEGEIVDMPADGVLHRRWTAGLTVWLARALDLDRYTHIFNTTLELSDYSAPSPDLQIYSADRREEEVRGDDILLAIEQADTSLKKDLRLKADLYARHGVRDYWVIDLNARRMHVHRAPSPDGYADVSIADAATPVEALLIPGLVLRLADLPRVGDRP